MVAEPSALEDNDENSELDGPSDADLAEMLGAREPLREEVSAPVGDGELPDLDTSRQRVPTKTQVLMDELFRAKLGKVLRVDPRAIK